MDRRWRPFLAVASTVILLVSISNPCGHALEVTDKLGIGGVLAGAYQQ